MCLFLSHYKLVIFLGTEDKSPTPDLTITNAFSRFKVTPVVEDNIQIPITSSGVTISQSAVISEQNQPQNVIKKQGRFQITRVEDEISLKTVTAEQKVEEKLEPQITVGSSVSISAENSQNLLNTVPSNISQNILLQHSCSNPALVSSVPDKITPCLQIPATSLTRSVSDIAFATGQIVQNVEKDASFNVPSDLAQKSAVYNISGNIYSSDQVKLNVAPCSVPPSEAIQHISGVTSRSEGIQQCSGVITRPEFIQQGPSVTARPISSMPDSTQKDIGVMAKPVSNEHASIMVDTSHQYREKPPMHAVPSDNLKESTSYDSSYPLLSYASGTLSAGFPHSAPGLTPGVACSTSISSSSENVRFSQYPVQYPLLNTADPQNMPNISSTCIAPASESGLVFSRVPSSIVQQTQQVYTDSPMKVSDAALYYLAARAEYNQLQQALAKDANANTLHSGHSFDGKNIPVNVRFFSHFNFSILLFLF